jgi:amidase
MWMSGAQASLVRIGEMLGRAVTADDVEPASWLMAEMAAGVSGLDLMQAQSAMHVYRRGVAEWWESGFDLLVTPTTCAPAPRLGELTPTPDDPLRGLTASIPYAAFTSPFNVTGQPAISLPVAQTPDGLPVGVQLVAAYGREDLLLQVAAQLEASEAFVKGTPSVHAS